MHEEAHRSGCTDCRTAVYTVQYDALKCTWRYRLSYLLEVNLSLYVVGESNHLGLVPGLDGGTAGAAVAEQGVSVQLATCIHPWPMGRG